MAMDKITEAISHFVGLFHLAAEQARLRQEYETFRAKKPDENDDPDLAPIDPDVSDDYLFLGFVPDLPYAGPAPELEDAAVDMDIGIPFFDLPDAWPFMLIPKGNYWVPGSASIMTPYDLEPPELIPPGSIAAVIIQHNYMADNDYVGVGTEGFVFRGVTGLSSDLDAFAAQAAALSPLGQPEIPGSAEAMQAFVTDLPGTFDAFFEDEANTANLVARGETINGRFVNAAEVDETPVLEDHRPVRREEDVREDLIATRHDFTGNSEGMDDNHAKTATGSTSKGQGGLDFEPFVDLDTGGNTLINEVVLTNNMLSGTAFAVMGESREVNAIVQINAWSDQDVVGAALDGWIKAAGKTEAFNIASFEREDRSETAPEATGFPQGWAVTRIDGDIIFLNWIEQINMMSDNDVAMMTSTGVKTTVTTGGNEAYNGASLNEFGLHYDLIIVGGGMYDANIISQLNILLDNDFIGTLDGFTTAGPGSYATSGNFLWNEATISTLGGAGRFEALPDYFRQAAEDFAAGKTQLPDSLFSDGALLGLTGLRVLYVSGSIYDINYISQKNVLGDSDQIALAMNALKPVAGASWSVFTGANELINSAYIRDLDSIGKTYVGGGRYSDELLLQAELVDFNPKLQRWDADKIVNEAIAFLDNDVPQWNGKDITPWGAIKGFVAHDGHDGVQSILA